MAKLKGIGLLTAVVMVAFAANSLLNRAALLDGGMGPSAFSLIRVGAGVATLLVLLALRDKTVPKPMALNLPAVAGLSAYMLGFSFAYVSMDAGLGALILFGGVQITMFAGALKAGERPPVNRWLGMFISLGGLAYLVWPSDEITLSASAFALMSLAALGWGAYSLIGRGVSDPLQATAWNFAYSLPVMALAWLALGTSEPVSQHGILLAIASGAIASGMGYALWYSVLPNLGTTVAGLAQLSVPAIALALGAVFLGEAITLHALLAAGMILGGIAFGIARLR